MIGLGQYFVIFDFFFGHAQTTPPLGWAGLIVWFVAIRWPGGDGRKVTQPKKSNPNQKKKSKLKKETQNNKKETQNHKKETQTHRKETQSQEPNF